MTEDVTPVAPLSVGGIRRGLYLVVIAVLQSSIVGTWIAKKFGFSTKLISIDDLQAIWLILAAIFSAVTAGYVGFQNIIKRIRVGQDPTNPAAPIKTSQAINTLVARLSE